MALNFNQLSGAVQNTSAVNLLQSVAQGLPSTEEKLGMNMEVEINNALSGLQELYNGGVEKMSLMNDNMDKFHFPNAFETWNKISVDWSDKQKLAARRAGINALSFKEAFDSQKALLMQGIGQNITNYQSMTKTSDSGMRNLFEEMPEVAKYINNNTMDPVINNLMTPNKDWTDQIGGFGKAILPAPGLLFGFEKDTLGEAAGKVAGYGALYKYGPDALAKGKEFFGISSKAKGSESILSKAKSIFSPKNVTGPSGEQLNLFDNKKTPSKSKIIQDLSKKIGKSRAFSLVAKLPKNPYLLLAALVGMGIYSLAKNKDTYQQSIDSRMTDTYGTGAPNPTDAFNQSMTAYKKKYNLK